MAVLCKGANLVDDALRLDAAVGAADEGNDAKGATMVAALLYLDKGSSAVFKARNHRHVEGFRGIHDI